MANVSGVAEFKNALRQLPAKLGEKVTKKALRQGANLVAKQVRANVPVKTGRLKKAIRVSNSRYNRLNRNGKVGVILRVRPGKSRADQTGAYYAGWVENGYNKGSKLIGGREAVARGVVTQQQYREKRAFLNSKRKFGQVRQGVRYRYGGNRVEGRYFVRNTFNALKETAAQLIIRNGTDGAAEAARELKLR